MTGTIIDVNLPTEQFALEHTLDTLRNVTFEVEQLVVTNRDNLMPFIWVGTTDQTTLEDAFAADESVADFEQIANFDTDCLYLLEWTDRVEDSIRILVEENATVLTATGQGDTWHIRLLFANHDAVTRTNEYCEENGLDFEVENIHEFANQRGNRFGLTSSQQRVLQLAAARGYYSVPREVSTESLAKEIGVSHQAISERLRRGHGNLVDHVLVDSAGTPEAPESEQPESKREARTD